MSCPPVLLDRGFMSLPDFRQPVLIVEDDRHIRELLTHHLERAGYECVPAADGKRALETAARRAFSLVVLDLMLPGVDGLAVCRELRREGINRDVPILMLTARHDERDKIQGLETGADDYVTKPFGVGELVARARALTRRARAGIVDLDVAWEQPIAIRGVEMDPNRREASVRGGPVNLTRQEFALLHLLATHPGIVFRRERLLARIWSGHTYVTERSVDALVKRLRRKIETNPAEPDLIVTVWGEGYKFPNG